MLEVEEIHAYYNNSHILQGATINVQNGQVVAVIGRNGVGKTTLMRAIMGLTPAREGRIKFKHADITRMSPHRIARMGIGLVPQGRRVFASLSVRENLEVTARNEIGGNWSMDNVIHLFPNLERRLTQLGNKLSGGEQQMLAVGRALVSNPDLLLLDEPTEGLAPLMVRELGVVMEKLKATGTSILIVEQQLAFVLRHADRIYIMSKGRIVHECSPAQLAEDRETKARYLGV